MDSHRYRTLAGTVFVAVGALFVLGFTTAEALYPGYSTAMDTISALGARNAPAASRLVFSGVMVAAGLLMAVGAYALHRVYDHRALSGVVAVTGLLGFVGVGVFPMETGAPHYLAAFVSFGGSGVIALVAATAVRGPFRYVAAVFGGLELAVLAAFIALGDGTPLGIGGLERWVAYLGVIWAIAFGGHLFPRSA